MVKTTPINSICFFSSYYTAPTLPIYVKFYLTELKRHFLQVVFLTNEKNVLPDDLKFLDSQNIPIRLYKNEGYDFGMWYKIFQEYDVVQYDRIALVNDSCILFKKLDTFFQWLEEEEVDYAGMTDCNNIQYHIQSYFLIINKNAILPVKEYFQRNGIIGDIKEVIKTYEVGLSQYLFQTGFKLKAYYSVKSIPFPFQRSLNAEGKFKGNLISYSKWKLYMCFRSMEYFGNPMWFETKQLIKQGMPMVKKKILARSYGDSDWYYMIKFGFDPIPAHYVRLVKKLYPEVDIEKLTTGVIKNLGWRKELMFYSTVYFSKCYFFVKHKIYVIKRAIVLMLGRY